MRWLKFNAVGAVGVVIHLGLLALFVHLLRTHYLLATAVAVEAAIVAKFIWHRHWTWSDRFDGGRNRTLSTLIRFNLSNGVVSISGNLLSAYALTTAWNLDPVLSNLVSIPICSIANFLLCDWFVFVTGGDS